MTPERQLEQIAETIRTLPRRRGEAVARARAEGMTWLQIADTLGMTQHGLIKSQRAYALQLTADEA